MATRYPSPVSGSASGPVTLKDWRLSLTAEFLILLLRFAMVLVLYLFLWQLLTVVWKDLHRPAMGQDQPFPLAGKLVVVAGGSTTYQPGHHFPLSASTTIGRGAQNSIVLSDSFISTDHAVLSLRDGEWWLADLGSRNGTVLNGERLEGDTPLHYGDIITLGQVKLKLTK